MYVTTEHIIIEWKITKHEVNQILQLLELIKHTLVIEVSSDLFHIKQRTRTKKASLALFKS